MTSKIIGKIGRVAVYGIVAVISLLAYTGCYYNPPYHADPIVLNYSGGIILQFNWTDGRASCPECYSMIVVVNTAERGNFINGPLPFNFQTVYLTEVLSGQNRTMTVLIYDATGNLIYKGVVAGVLVTAGQTNPPVLININPRGWYPVGAAYSSADWGLSDVRMIWQGNGWAAGFDNAGATGAKGVVFRATGDVWTANTLTVAPSTSTNWKLNSIAPSGAGAWAVGEDIQHTTGIILRNDGATWYDGVPLPVITTPWRLTSVDFTADGIGWAVGESGTPAVVGVILKYNSGWATFTGPDPLLIPNYTLNTVVGLPGGEFIAGGQDLTSNTGLLIHWNATDSIYDTYAPPPGDMTDCAGPKQWRINDVHVISASDWWAVGTCHDPSLVTPPPDFGMIFHYQTATNLRREALTSPGGYSLESVWANAAGDAWTVGPAATVPIIFRRNGGTWAQELPHSELTSWLLNAVDFPAIGFGYSVGTDRTGKKGLIFQYGFPN